MTTMASLRKIDDAPGRDKLRPCKVLIGTDFWGAGNLGDDFMLAGFTLWVQAYAPHWIVSILCAHGIEAMRQRFPQFSWVAADETSRLAAHAQADLWLGLGGSVFQSDGGPWILDRVAADLAFSRSRGIPSFLVGVGLNDDEALETSQAREIHRLAGAIWTRDARCRRAMLEAGFEAAKVHPGADLAHLAFWGRPDLTGARGLSGVAACLIAAPWQVDCEALVQALRTEDEEPTWLCQEVRSLPGSELNLYDSMPPMLREQVTLCCPDYLHASLADLEVDLLRFRVVLTSRYHMTLASAWAGAQLAVFDRNRKLTGIREELGIAECTSLSSREQITQSLQSARPVERHRLDACAQRALAMLEHLKALATTAAETVQ
jgi:polysaccharide pyruvyl transferase WcaK-like protein